MVGKQRFIGSEFEGLESIGDSKSTHWLSNEGPKLVNALGLPRGQAFPKGFVEQGLSVSLCTFVVCWWSHFPRDFLGLHDYGCGFSESKLNVSRFLAELMWSPEEPTPHAGHPWIHCSDHFWSVLTPSLTLNYLPQLDFGWLYHGTSSSGPHPVALVDGCAYLN